MREEEARRRLVREEEALVGRRGVGAGGEGGEEEALQALGMKRSSLSAFLWGHVLNVDS